MDEVEFGKDAYDDDQPQKPTKVVEPPLPEKIVIPAFNPAPTLIQIPK